MRQPWTRALAAALVGAVTLLSPEVARAQEPAAIRDAELSIASAAGGLEPVLRQAVASIADRGWIGYEVTMVPGKQAMCCFSGSEAVRPCVCPLEERGRFRTEHRDDDVVELETNRRLRVLMRVDAGRIDRVRMYSSDCILDAGGLPLRWLSDVDPTESVAMLEHLVEGSGELWRLLTLDAREDGREAAVGIVASHAGQGALDALTRWAQGGLSGELREQAIFWLAAARDPAGFGTLRDLAQGDPDPEIRAHTTFALSISNRAEAVDVLIQVARADRSADVRGQAIFWLAQHAGERAAGTIEGAIEHDPDEDVKTQAVFALGQLPPDRGVPLLIHVARTNRSAEVRKRAIFWLGQSGDDRALDFIEELLR